MESDNISHLFIYLGEKCLNWKLFNSLMVMSLRQSPLLSDFIDRIILNWSMRVFPGPGFAAPWISGTVTYRVWDHLDTMIYMNVEVLHFSIEAYLFVFIFLMTFLCI